MYEHLRNDFISNLPKDFSSSQINKILASLDITMANYDVTEKCTALAVYEGKVPELVKMYIASKRLEGLSERSLVFYYGRLRIFFETIMKNPLDVDTNDIRLFLSTYPSLSEHGVSDRTLDKFRQIIHGFYNWLCDEDYMAKNPCRNIKEIKYEVVPRRSLTRFQLEQLRRACDTKRDLAIVDTLYSTGCRVSELINMKISQINTEKKCIHIVGKGRKHNDVYFNTNAQISVNEYLATRTDDCDYLFVNKVGKPKQVSVSSVEKLFRDLADKCGFFVTPHIMRHTTATLALASGMPMPQVQYMLGHSNITTTQNYVEVSQRDVMNSHIKYVV